MKTIICMSTHSHDIYSTFPAPQSPYTRSKKKEKKKKSNYFVLNNNNNNLGVALPFEKLLQCIKITLKFKCNIFLGTLQQKKATEMLILQIKIFKNS